MGKRECTEAIAVAVNQRAVGSDANRGSPRQNLVAEGGTPCSVGVIAQTRNRSTWFCGSYGTAGVWWATTVVNEKNNWLTLGAYNFTFSAPTVSVKLTQDKPQVVTPAKPAIKKITCVKGKTTKVVAATKCPSGYKKKA